MNTKVHKLRVDVVNPDADGRRRDDWRYAKTWRAGTEFVIDTTDDTTTISKVGRRGSLYDRAIVKLIADASDVIDESPEAMLTRLQVDLFQSRGFYLHLISSGRLTAAEFARAWDEYIHSDDDEEAKP